jgi:hypothetical protein
LEQVSSLSQVELESTESEGEGRKANQEEGFKGDEADFWIKFFRYDVTARVCKNEQQGLGVIQQPPILIFRNGMLIVRMLNT